MVIIKIEAIYAALTMNYNDIVQKFYNNFTTAPSFLGNKWGSSSYILPMGQKLRYEDIVAYLTLQPITAEPLDSNSHV